MWINNLNLAFWLNFVCSFHVNIWFQQQWFLSDRSSLVLPGGVFLYAKVCVYLSFSLTEELPAKSSRILSGNTLSEHPPLFYKRHSRPTLPAVPYFRDHSSSPLSQQRLPSSQPHTKTKTQLVLSIGRSWPKNGLKVCSDRRER